MVEKHGNRAVGESVFAVAVGIAKHCLYRLERRQLRDSHCFHWRFSCIRRLEAEGRTITAYKHRAGERLGSRGISQPR